MKSNDLKLLLKSPKAMMDFHVSGKVPRAADPRSPLITLLERLTPSERSRITSVIIDCALGYSGRHIFRNAEQALGWLKPQIPVQHLVSESYQIKSFNKKLVLNDLAMNSRMPNDVISDYNRKNQKPNRPFRLQSEPSMNDHKNILAFEATLRVTSPDDLVEEYFAIHSQDRPQSPNFKVTVPKALKFFATKMDREPADNGFEMLSVVMKSIEPGIFTMKVMANILDPLVFDKAAKESYLHTGGDDEGYSFYSDSLKLAEIVMLSNDSATPRDLGFEIVATFDAPPTPVRKTSDGYEPS